ncbi:MAG: hypothetical protein GY757_49525, partial [bacterium]|nr:hypothetical protein [bacterium]
AAVAFKPVEVEATYLPFSYKEIKIFRPFPRKIISYMTYLDKKEKETKQHTKNNNPELLRFDITVTDENGTPLLQVEEYSMRIVTRVTGTAPSVTEPAGVTGTPAGVTGTEQKGVKNDQPHSYILTHEGVAVFDRVLNTDLAQVICSTRPLETRMEERHAEKETEEVEEIETTSKTLYPRPELSSPYTAPTNTSEEKLTAIWQNFLGFEKVGIHDDFFLLCGDSLKGMNLINTYNKLSKENVSLNTMFDAPTISQQIDYLTEHYPGVISGMLTGGPTGKAPGAAGTNTEKYSEIEHTEKREYFTLSSAQKRIYFLQQMDPESVAYNIIDTIPLPGETDPVKLEKTLIKLIRRHESLRTSFSVVGEEPVQFIHENVDLKFERHEHKNITGNICRPFDLSRAPLLRAGIINLERETPHTHAPGKPHAPGRHILLMEIHHIITDAVSQDILTKEFYAEYTGRDLPPLKFQYRDFAKWQNRRIQKGILQKQEKFWL